MGVQFLSTDFGRLSASFVEVFAVFGSRTAFLRFKANFACLFGSLRKRGLIQTRFSIFGSEGCELAEAFVEGALMGGLVAQIEGQLSFVAAARKPGAEGKAL